jgi:hypothetical protein
MRCTARTLQVAPALTAIKAALKELPKVDLLSPFRVHLVGYADR